MKIQRYYTVLSIVNHKIYHGTKLLKRSSTWLYWN